MDAQSPARSPGSRSASSAWLDGGGSVDVAWAPTLDLRLDFALDGLGALYALLATGIGTVVFAYGAAYLPLHLEHERRPATEDRRFWPWMTLFMVSMVGLACARDLILLFVFFDLTAVASYFLIGFDRDQREARGAALMALLVTGISAVALLLGAVLLYDEYGTFSLPELFARAAGDHDDGDRRRVDRRRRARQERAGAAALLAAARDGGADPGVGLPALGRDGGGRRARARPRPPAARTRPDRFSTGCSSSGWRRSSSAGCSRSARTSSSRSSPTRRSPSTATSSRSTGSAARPRAGAAALYVIAHAIAKSALFMTAGAVTMATGESRLSHLGGLARRMPVLAVASGIAAATLAALPLTLGFFKDELFFGAATEKGPLVTMLAVLAAALTFAYIGRFWLGLFTGARRTDTAARSRRCSSPQSSCWPRSRSPAASSSARSPRLAGDAATVTHGAAVDVSPAYHLDARAENIDGAGGLGARRGVPALRARPRRRRRRSRRAPATASGRAAGTASTLRALNVFSDRLHDAEVRDLRNSIAAVLVPTGVLVALGFAFTPTSGSFTVGSVEPEDLPILVLLVLCVAAAFTVVRDPGRLRPVLALSVLGFALAAVYAVTGAPDVALVAVLVETIFTLVFVGVFSRLAAAAPARGPRAARRTRRNVAGRASSRAPRRSPRSGRRSRGRARAAATRPSRSR